MVLKIGSVDMIPFLVKDGIKWTRSDIDGPNAGRLLNGDMQRDRVATKIRWDLTCRPLKPNELAMILSAIRTEFVTVSYTDPVTNAVKSGKFYANNFPATLYGTIADGTELWSGLTFPLIEK